MSYDEFERHPDFAREFQEVGVSVHGVNEAEHVERQGADFCIAGHIFTTQCKPGVERAALISSGASLRTRPFPSMRSAASTRTISLRCAMLVRMAHA